MVIFREVVEVSDLEFSGAMKRSEVDLDFSSWVLFPALLSIPVPARRRQAYLPFLPCVWVTLPSASWQTTSFHIASQILGPNDDKSHWPYCPLKFWKMTLTDPVCWVWTEIMWYYNESVTRAWEHLMLVFLRNRIWNANKCEEEHRNAYGLPQFLENSYGKWCSHTSDIFLKTNNIVVFYVTLNMLGCEAGFSTEL